MNMEFLLNQTTRIPGNVLRTLIFAVLCAGIPDLYAESKHDELSPGTPAKRAGDRKSLTLHTLPALITGKVVDEKGEGLPGVSVLLKGTSTGAVTDATGSYRIEANPGDILVFSFVGFSSQEVTVGAQTTVNITLQVSSETLEEVIVVGYGSQAKRDITSSVVSIGAPEIKDMPVASLDQTLQGRVPGVVVINNTGEPGGGMTMRIRGTSTIGSGSDPLFVVDGIPLDNEQTSNRNVGEARINGLSQINPSDIESMEIPPNAVRPAARS
jgi:TonB-dependent starch-binding outer membrane protein SusC